jgi:hypothetical protein
MKYLVIISIFALILAGALVYHVRTVHDIKIKAVQQFADRTDLWGTPLESLGSKQVTIIRSAGPDKIMDTDDDIYAFSQP